MLLRSILATSALSRRFLSEQMLVQQLDSVSDQVKTTKESQQLSTLIRELDQIHFSSGTIRLRFRLGRAGSSIDVLLFPIQHAPFEINFPFCRAWR